MSHWLRQPGGLVSVILAGLCALFLLLILVQRMVSGGAGRDAAVAVAPRDADLASSLTAREFELPGLERYAEVTSRPLFHEDRQPEENSGGAEQEADPDLQQVATLEPPPVTLSGVIITPDMRVAMLTHNRRNEQLVLKPGETLDGWTLESVEERQVVFASGGASEPLLLEVYTGGSRGGRRGREQQQAAAGEEQEQSAADLIRERIARERERRRELIERARERQQESDQDQ